MVLELRTAAWGHGLMERAAGRWPTSPISISRSRRLRLGKSLCGWREVGLNKSVPPDDRTRGGSIGTDNTDTTLKWNQMSLMASGGLSTSVNGAHWRVNAWTSKTPAGPAPLLTASSTQPPSQL